MDDVRGAYGRAKPEQVFLAVTGMPVRLIHPGPYELCPGVRSGRGWPVGEHHDVTAYYELTAVMYNNNKNDHDGDDDDGDDVYYGGGDDDDAKRASRHHFLLL